MHNATTVIFLQSAMSLKHFLRNPWLFLISLALNILLLAIFIFTLQKAQFFYKEYRVFRPLAQGVSEATTFEIPDQRADKLLIMYGDSRVSKWKPHPELNNTLIVNAGVAGDSVLEMRRRIDQDVLRLKPDAVLLQVGMNDLTAAATRGIKDPEKIIRRMKSQIQFVIEHLIEHGIEVIVTPIIPATPIGISRQLFWRNEIDTMLTDANIYLKSLADKHSLQWIDLLVPLHDEKGDLRTDWYVDPLHLYQSKYTALNSTIEAALN